MVGGSVSGRTFKPDPSSYEATGIPCGNPLRYKNRSILRMVPDKAIPFENQQLGVPGKGTQTEAENHLKGMLKTQLETNISLQSASRKRKSFCEPIFYDDSKEKASGVMTLTKYNELDIYKQKQEELTHIGLDQDEVELALIDCGLANQDIKKRNYGVNPSIEEERRKVIEEKVRSKEEKLSQQTTFSNVMAMSRHAMEVEMSLNRGTEKSNTLSHLVQSKHEEDPALEAVLREYHNKQCDYSSASASTLPDYSKSGSYRTHEDDETEVVLPLDEEVIKRHRLALDEIRQIPRFKDYVAGAPTEVLYLKNLAKRVSERDLQALFNRFETNDDMKSHIRLMTGRMKGQAFVTFSDEETAIQAFTLVNGYQLYGRPIIIQYGRKEKEEAQRQPANV